MIFITTGTQAPFDRLLEAMDDIADDLDGQKIVAQAFKGSYKAKNIDVCDFLAPQEFKKLFAEASLIISHAGMGTIISALTMGKPIIVMPRRVALGEHRNEHQMATAKKMDEMGYVYVVYSAEELKTKVLEIANKPKPEPLHQLGEWASKELTLSLREYILSNT